MIASFKKMSFKEFLLYLIIFAVVLTPSLPMPGPLPNIRLEELLVFAFIVFGAIWLCSGRKVRLHISALQPLFLFFGAVILFSVLVGASQGLNPSFRDFMEHVKLIKYLAIFTVVATLSDTEERRQRSIDLTIGAIVVSALIGVTQYFNFLGLNEWYIRFIAPTHYQRLIGHPSPRIVGMSANPNEYAVIAAIGVLVCIAMFLKHRRRRYILGAGISMLGLLMTHSRSGVVFLITALVFFLFLHFLRLPRMSRRQRKLSLNFFSCGLIFFILFIIFAPEAFTWRLVEGMNLAASTSWQARLIHWEESLALIRQSPFFGWGPAGNINFRWAPDNEWFFLVRHYGIFGTAYLVLAFLLPVLFTPERDHSRFYKDIYLSILFGAAFHMIAAVIYHSLQVMSLVMVFAGLFSSAATKEQYRFRWEIAELFQDLRKGRKRLEIRN